MGNSVSNSVEVVKSTEAFRQRKGRVNKQKLDVKVQSKEIIAF